MYNKTIMIGNLTRDIELKYLPSGSAVAKSSIASSYKYKSQSGEQKEEVCFLEFNMFGRSAEIANQYLKKGSKVLLEGRLIFEQWTDSSGGTRSKHSLRVDVMKMLGDNNIQIESNKEYEKPEQIKQSKPYELKNIEIDINEDEIPF